MPYVTSIERMGIEQGLEQGLERQRSMLIRQLTRKIGLLPEGAIAQISQFSTDQLDYLADALLDFACVDDLIQWLAMDR